MRLTEEHLRLAATTKRQADWKKWGPYLAERAWGTVREDYSADGSAWSAFPHEHARSRVYRWNEDGLAGLCDRRQKLCFGWGFWNGRDPFLKERLFGLTGLEGNHGEDAKEVWHYLDSTPTHSFMRMHYRYPQREFPYELLRSEARRRNRREPEFELEDTGVFEDGRYWDLLFEVAKATPDDLVLSVTAINCGPEQAELVVLAQLWFRNTWSWGRTDEPTPELRAFGNVIQAHGSELGTMHLHTEGARRLAFTDNETNRLRCFGLPNTRRYLKDAFHDLVVRGHEEAVNPALAGTKAAAIYKLRVAAGQRIELRLRLRDSFCERAFDDFAQVIETRRREADEFYRAVQPASLTDDERNVQRQAYAGLLWSKQFYSYDVVQWLDGDPAGPVPPAARRDGRNRNWRHLHGADILSMPDKWEYPWFAAWDTAFHCVALAHVDPAFAKRQLVLLLREWYMHPSGQIPAYEWSFEDVNPPVHAWAAWRVYKIEKKATGAGDTVFLERIFHKLLLNFTWWVNRKDLAGRNVFQGGFLGMDNVGVFDRSSELPGGARLEQSDSTSWMAMFSLTMMVIALELAMTSPAYEDAATKFFEHFMYIAQAMNHVGGTIELWSERDGFFYDVLQRPGHSAFKLRVRSMVGLIPLLAVETIECSLLQRFPRFGRRMDWFLDNRPDMARLVSRWQQPGQGERRLLALLRGHRMKCVLRRMLDPGEFLSAYGIRSLSRIHAEQPYILHFDGAEHRVEYEPGESTTSMFGGNSNWRGPIWFPVNYLLIEALQKFHHYYGDDFLVECPTGSGRMLTLKQTADEVSARLMSLFLRDGNGVRPCAPNRAETADWGSPVLFHEYFDAESGKGLGASHQTGWTALAARLLHKLGTQRDGREG